MQVLNHHTLTAEEADAQLARLQHTPNIDLLIIARYLANEVNDLRTRIEALETV